MYARDARLREEAKPARAAWPGFSRITAVSLWNHGYRSAADLCGVPVATLAAQTRLSDSTITNVLKRVGLATEDCPYCGGHGRVIVRLQRVDE